LQHDVGAILSQADLLLMTSRAESFCLAALEAMACGLPVLATRVGGLPEVVINGETGCLFPVDQPAVAVDLAVDLLSNPVQHRAMQQAALMQAARYSAHRIVPHYETLYQNLLERSWLAAA
jgi:glycosyltransferase involved in cell wall biosynthesis